MGLTSFLIGNLPSAGASWLIEPERFHISVHGQNSCQDCHENISGKDRHPDPADVKKALADFFATDQCVSCHDHIPDELENGFHAEKRVDNPKEYERCIRCHNPHYQVPLGERQASELDPAMPREELCGACHRPRDALPPPSDGDRACFACHLLPKEEGSQRTQGITKLCFNCHGEAKGEDLQEQKSLSPLIDQSAYVSTPHAKIDCIQCHPDAARFQHASQEPGDCQRCHVRHDEKVAHDVHTRVACGACHLDDIKPAKQAELKLVRWLRERGPGEVSTIHQMVRLEEESCQRCHFKGNRLGAVAMTLPPKSILCMPCHAATFSVGDATTIIAMVIFLVGMVMTFSVWLSGSLPGDGAVSALSKIFKLSASVVRVLFSPKIFLIIKAMFLDVLLQRRLFVQSVTRWLIHSLIFLPFVFRFLWGLIALFASLWQPEWVPAWAMLDRNNPTTAFLFDVTGVMVIVGIGLAIIRGLLIRSSRFPGLPGQDFLALGLIAGIVVAGFILEGMRIGMTGWPDSGSYAFLGSWISTLFSDPSGLPEVYGYVWYAHAILTGAFVAYLPFSRMMHIIMAPVVLAMNAASESEHS
jgi:nitrate reductase gamma subunit